MQHLTQIELANWIALYVATGFCCAIAFALAWARTLIEVYHERPWAAIRSAKAALLFVPRTWWRWQKLYLTSTPVTLIIVAMFAATMSWG